MSKVIDGARTCFLTQHMNHMNGLLLFWEMCARGGGDKIIGIGTNVDVRLLGTNIHPQTTQHLTSTKTFHQGVKLSNGGGQCGPVDFVGLKLHQRTIGILMLASGFSHKNGLSTLRARI